MALDKTASTRELMRDAYRYTDLIAAARRQSGDSTARIDALRAERDLIEDELVRRAKPNEPKKAAG